jgi:hypothetical protein
VLKQTQSITTAENQELLDLLNVLVQRLNISADKPELKQAVKDCGYLDYSSVDTNHRQKNRSQEKGQLRKAEKQKLKNRFRNFLSITPSSS